MKKILNFLTKIIIAFLSIIIGIVLSPLCLTFIIEYVKSVYNNLYVKLLKNFINNGE